MELIRIKFKFDRERVKYGLRWISLSILVGAAVGLVIVLFDYVLGSLIKLVGSFNIWIIICLPVLGLFLSGEISRFIAPETRGHGTDAIINAYHQNWGIIRGRTVPAKFAASILNVGLGGSAGPEGPAVQIGGGISSFIGQKIKISLKERKTLMLCGLSAGFGAIFMAPLSGAVFACEVVYREDFEYFNLLPCAISSVVGFLTYKNLITLSGFFKPLIQIPSITYSFNWPDIFVFLGVGLICGLFGLIFIKVFYYIDAKFLYWKKSEWIKTTVGGVLVTCLVLLLMIFALNFSSSINNALLILGLGWPLVNILGNNPLLFSLQFLILLLIFKLLATCLTLGSGGSGGIVAPSIVIGGLIGNIIVVIFTPYLGGGMQQAIIVVSSIVLFASIAHIPLTGMLMGGELYGINFIIPTLLASVIGSWIITNDSIYRSSLMSKGEDLKIYKRFKEIK
jgi:CIC family chloride channel protein